MYHINLKHDGLKKFRRLSGTDRYVLEQRARVQTEAWDQRWRRQVMPDQHSDGPPRPAPNFEAMRAHAVRETNEAQRAVAPLEDILLKGLEVAPFKMEMLYDERIFPEPRPVAPVDQEAPPEPTRDDPCFNVVEDESVEEFWSLLPPILKRKRERAAQSKRDAAQSKFDLAHRSWQEAKNAIDCLNAKAAVLFELGLDEWWARAQAYQKQQQDDNTQIDGFRQRYSQGKPDAVIEFLDAALSHSELPDIFPMQWEMEFVPETGALIVDYELPSADNFPTLKSVKYDLLRDAFEKIYRHESEVAQLYDSAIYQTCLRTLHDLFAADEADVIVSATFNGWVNFTDKVNGKPAQACIMSVQITKAAFQQINLGAVDPEKCFRTLNGVASTKLASTSAVVPILRLKRSNDWFVPANDAIETVSETTVDWDGLSNFGPPV